jgi:uncharacterized protein YndB with AHSA1/START domain
MSQQTSELVIEKSITVAAPVDRAFRVFTAELGSWWPLASKSVSQKDAETVIVEPRVGGRVVERARGGEEHLWGEVLVWEPSSRFAFSWHPGRAPETAQEVDVRFTAEGETTRVDLEHRGWESLVGPGGEIPSHFDTGWDAALVLYRELVERS